MISVENNLKRRERGVEVIYGRGSKWNGMRPLSQLLPFTPVPHIFYYLNLQYNILFIILL